MQMPARKAQAVRTLSKSTLMNFRQCPKRLWLEIHRPELKEESADTEARFAVGHQVGEIARQLYDPEGKGQLIDARQEGYDSAFARSAALLKAAQPIFEAGFKADGVLAFADVLLPIRKNGKRAWRMVEVKSTTSVKDYHHDDTAIQAFIARNADVPLASIALSHIDSKWVYPGSGDYRGLLVEVDLTEKAFGRAAEVKAWIEGAQAVAGMAAEPSINTGRQCSEPHPCGFIDHCQGQEPQAEYPVHSLPRVQTNALKRLIDDGGVTDLREVPDHLLNDTQLRVKTHSLSGDAYFNGVGAAAALTGHKLPAVFIDFETIYLAVPIWAGTRPYQQIPYQFSVHRLSRTGKLDHMSFLDLSANDPSTAFAEALIGACGERGPVFVYNATFEVGRIRELANRFPMLKRSLLAINDRVVDLLPVAQEHFYHPSQEGSWSIKKVLPAVAPDLSYDDLEEVQDGGMATSAYLEAITPGTAAARKAQIEQQLLAYCGLDTLAMVRLWKFFSGRSDPVI